MRCIVKSILLFSITLSCPVFGKVCDTAKVDTIILAPDKIQKVEIACNTVAGQKKPEVINSQSEFNRFIGNNCHTTPPVDFSTQTLLYFPTKAAGCKAEYERTVKIAGNYILYQVRIVLHNECTLLLFNSNAIVIPKLDSKSGVHFQKTETIKHGVK